MCVARSLLSFLNFGFSGFLAGAKVIRAYTRDVIRVRYKCKFSSEKLVLYLHQILKLLSSISPADQNHQCKEISMQQVGFGFLKDFKKEFGGSLIVGKRKTARPLSVKSPIHLILKSTGASCFVPGSRKLESLIRAHAEKYGIKIYRMSLNWSHIHMVMKLPDKKAYVKFIRTITSRIVAYLSKLKGKNLKGLFDLRPFTKILS